MPRLTLVGAGEVSTLDDWIALRRAINPDGELPPIPERFVLPAEPLNEPFNMEAIEAAAWLASVDFFAPQED